MKAMKINLSLAVLLTFFVAGPLAAQNTTWLSVEGGSILDYTPTGSVDKVFSRNAYNGTGAGVMLWQSLGSGFMLGSGLAWNPIYEGYQVTDQRPGAAGRYLATNYQVPFRMAFRFGFGHSPFFMWFRTGYLLGFMSDSISTSSGSGLISNSRGQVISYNYTTTPLEFTRNHMFEVGLTGGILLGNNWELGLNFLYMGGRTKFSQTALSYTTSSGLSGDANIINRANNLQLTAVLMVPVSNIWVNKDIRVRKKIEHSIYAGKETDQSNSIYFGGTIGSLWRVFNYSNPSITARPSSQRGIFRYANLSTGAYIGYMFSGSLGMDIGGYYQRSTLLVTANYDQDNSVTVKEQAPMFIEIPIRIRYLRNLYKQQLYFTASGGGSALLQFAGPAYLSGSTAFQYTNLAGSVADGTMNYTGNRLSMFGGLFRFSAGMEYRFRIKFPLVVTAELAYGHGFVTLDETEVSTSISEQPAISTVSYSGTGWRIDLGVKIPVKLGQKGKSKCGALPRIR